MSKSSLFSEYEPNADRLGRIDNLSVRIAREIDVDAIARLAADREGGSVKEHARHIVEELQSRDARRYLGVAEREGQVIGFARCGWYDGMWDAAPATVATPNATAGESPESPPGAWALLGIIVASRFRRRGVGRALTVHRMQWLAQRGDYAFYFVNAQNRASIDLHAEFGFAPVDEDYRDANITFEGGRGVLFRAVLQPWRNR
jgi:ribosomal protein S18 acetylase RimI-like enzyme